MINIDGLELPHPNPSYEVLVFLKNPQKKEIPIGLRSGRSTIAIHDAKAFLVPENNTPRRQFRISLYVSQNFFGALLQRQAEFGSSLDPWFHFARPHDLSPSLCYFRNVLRRLCEHLRTRTRLVQINSPRLKSSCFSSRRRASFNTRTSTVEHPRGVNP